MSYRVSPAVQQACHFICILGKAMSLNALGVLIASGHLYKCTHTRRIEQPQYKQFTLYPITVHVMGYSPLLSVQINESAISVNPNTLSVCSLYCILCTGCRQLSTNYQQFTL